MSTGTVQLKVGGHVWWDGALWELSGFGDGRATLARGGRTATLTIARLAELSFDAAAPSEDDTPDAERSSATLLSMVSTADRDRVERLAAEISALLSDESTLLRPRIEVAAKRLGMSTRSLDRRIAAYRRAGVAGLVDTRMARAQPSRVDPRWDDACRRALKSFTHASTPTRAAVIARTTTILEREYGPDVVPMPHQATAYRRIKQLAEGKYTFGGAKGRRSVAERPDGAYGRLRADRPGQYVVLDTYDLDVFAMEPVTCRWVKVQLTIAMDLFSRCILGLRLTPLSTKAIDIANVLYQCIRPETVAPNAVDYPYHGVPETLLVGTEVLTAPARFGRGLPAAFPESIVVDHGKQYLSAHVISACARLGISVQPALPKKPTDKPNVERFFRTLRQSLLEYLPAYKGPDVYNRGLNVEAEAFLWIGELEQIIREWVGTIYHHTPHDGLTLPEVPRAKLSPIEAYNLGLARSGGLVIPANEALVFEFLDVKWRKIHHYGIEVDGLRYNGRALNAYRDQKSPHGGRHAGKWPIHIDPHDVRYVYFRDPSDGAWHRLEWEHAPALDGPFSHEASEYAKRLAIAEDRHVDPKQAVDQLVTDWSRGAVTQRRDRNLAVRLSTQRHQKLDETAKPSPQQTVADLPSVVSLEQRRETRRSALPVDDIDVFEQYPPDVFGFAVIDE